MEPGHGSVAVVDLPEPALRPAMLLVRNAYSVISPGTERNAIKIGETVTVTGSLAKDGSNLANATAVTLADGKRVFAASSNADSQAK